MTDIAGSNSDHDPPPRSLSEILDALKSLGQEREVVSVDDIVLKLGRAGTAALLFVPGVIATTPLSGIPGLSALCGITIALVAGQAMLGRRKQWLPKFVTRRKVEGARISDALEKVGGIIGFLDRHTHERLHFLVRGLGKRVLYAICLIGGLTMPFLELIPFSASAVAACVTVISVAILTLDGVLAVAAFALLAGAAGLLAWLI